MKSISFQANASNADSRRIRLMRKKATDLNSLLQREEAKIAATVTTIPTRDTANHITEKGVSSILEDNVDERYYLSDEMASKLIEKPTDGIVRQVGYIKKTENGTQHQSNTVYDPNGAARTLTACDYKSPMMIKEEFE